MKRGIQNKIRYYGNKCLLEYFCIVNMKKHVAFGVAGMAFAFRSPPLKAKAAHVHGQKAKKK